jgi:hypothetical protein
LDNSSCPVGADPLSWLGSDADAWVTFSGGRATVRAPSGSLPLTDDSWTVMPLACGDEAVDWRLTIMWRANGRTGRTVVGPFRALPDQRLPERALSGAGTVTALPGAQAAHPCRDVPRTWSRLFTPSPVGTPRAVTCPDAIRRKNGGKAVITAMNTSTPCGTARQIAGDFLARLDQSPPPAHTSAVADVGAWRCFEHDGGEHNTRHLAGCRMFRGTQAYISADLG